MQNYVVVLGSTLPRSQYDYALPQASFAAVGYQKHITLVFSPTVRGTGVALPWISPKMRAECLGPLFSYGETPETRMGSGRHCPGE